MLLNLMNAKAIQRGRQTMGASVITGAAMMVWMVVLLVMVLTVDRSMFSWMGGWKPRSIKING